MTVFFNRATARTIDFQPVEFADAAGGKPHVHARDLCRDREVVHIHLARPAAVLDAAMHHGE
jgi:hypothetical protein